MNCSCCTSCCSDNVLFCAADIHQVCHNYASDWQVNYLQSTANCTCASDSLSFSCTFGECETCNDDLMICGVVKEFEFALDRWGVFDDLKISFQYTRGRPHSVVSWRSFLDSMCKVSVNGTDCHCCNSQTACNDGFLGVRIDCGNVLNVQDGPTAYQTCFPEEGGILDVFGWMDRESSIGCPLISLREIIV